MSRITRFLQVTVLVSSAVFAACGDDYASAQTSTSVKQQIKESMGDAPARIDTTTAYRLSAAFRGAAEQALPAVVRVSVTTEARTVASRQRSPLERLLPGFPGFDDPQGGQQQPTPRGGRGTGSGFVFDARGYIMTNNHVVEGADRVLVTMVDGREYNATVVGNDPNTDVAVIKIDPARGERLMPVEFGSSDDLHVGDWVIALGNPLNLQFTVTAGIVSAKGRSLNILGGDQRQGLESFIQTDAVINPGNSGGPMVDLTGKVVGINSAIESSTGYWAGNGFAIPIDLARKVASDIMEFGHVRRPRLGVEVGQITAADAEVYKLPSVAGAEITSVQPGEAADRAGIQMGDVVVALNGEPIRSQTEFMEELARQRAGEKVRISLIRFGQKLDRQVTLGEFENAPTRVAQPAERPRTQDLLGFSAEPVTPEIARALQSGLRTGVVINAVDPLSSAYQNVIPGDIVRKINGRDVNTVEDLERIASGLKAGSTVTIIARGRGVTYDRIINYRLR